MDVIVIGAGASGLCSAIVMARNGVNVTVLDKLSVSGKKLLVTGNGRCNYWNEDFDNKHFFSNNSNFINDVNTLENRKMVLDFFDSIGIVPVIKNGYYYPMSMQASSVRDSLILEAKRLGVKFINDANVTDIRKDNQKYIVCYGDNKIISDKVVIACGSYSYYKDKTNGYDLCRRLGHTIKRVMPSLVQLVGSDNFYSEWDGVRSSAKVGIYVDNELKKEETGEIMLTNYGVSGICIFNLSGIANRALSDNKNVKIKINFLPEIDNLFEFLENRSNMIDYTLYDFLISLLNFKLVNLILKECNLNRDKNWKDLNDIEKNILVEKISTFVVNIIDSKSFLDSQVSTGGVDTLEIDSHTMESKINKGLYIVGEVLDVDGDCGGYNLGFAWLSGIIAGRSVVND